MLAAAVRQPSGGGRDSATRASGRTSQQALASHPPPSRARLARQPAAPWIPGPRAEMLRPRRAPRAVAALAFAGAYSGGRARRGARVAGSQGGSLLGGPRMRIWGTAALMEGTRPGARCRPTRTRTRGFSTRHDRSLRPPRGGYVADASARGRLPSCVETRVGHARASYRGSGVYKRPSFGYFGSQPVHVEGVGRGRHTSPLRRGEVVDSEVQGLLTSLEPLALRMDWRAAVL